MSAADISSLPTRRQFNALLAFAGLNASLATAAAQDDRAAQPWKPRYILGSCLYGYSPLADIVPEVTKCGATAIDIWPMVHGNQREQLDELGEAQFSKLLDEHSIKLGCITQYKLGPFALQDEMRLAKRLGCSTIVTGAKGPVGLKGDALKQAVVHFIEQMKPHLAVAEETGVTIAIENHAKNLIESPDSLRWLAELRPSKHLAIGLAPYHLEQDAQQIASLIRDLGDSIEVFYAWQHGNGSHEKMAKSLELTQLPGRGPLDFTPLMEALRDIRFEGWTEIFMHPFPRGIPILETTEQVTAEINLARRYLDSCLS
ncbi:MAG: sugar phosphate isomerase/epimerase family protein [Planctomycetaceae bacterium]